MKKNDGITMPCTVKALLFCATTMAFALLGRGQTQTICLAGPAPAGWVTTSFGPKCDSTGTRSRNIQKIDGLAPGTVITICNNDLPPSGWVTISWGDSAASIGRRPVYRYTVENLNGLPSGTKVTVCGYDMPPNGWAVDSTGGTCATIKGIAFPSMVLRKL